MVGCWWSAVGALSPFENVKMLIGWRHLELAWRMQGELLLEAGSFVPCVFLAQFERMYLNITSSPPFSVPVHASNFVNFSLLRIWKWFASRAHHPVPLIKRPATTNLMPFSSFLLKKLPLVPFRTPAGADQYGPRSRCWFWRRSRRRPRCGGWMSAARMTDRSTPARRTASSPARRAAAAFLCHRFVQSVCAYCIACTDSGCQLLLKFIQASSFILKSIRTGNIGCCLCKGERLLKVWFQCHVLFGSVHMECISVIHLSSGKNKEDGT